MSDVKLQVSLPADIVEAYRQQAIESGRTIGDVLRQTLANGQYLTDIVESGDKDLLIEDKQTNKLAKVSFTR